MHGVLLTDQYADLPKRLGAFEIRRAVDAQELLRMRRQEACSSP